MEVRIGTDRLLLRTIKKTDDEEIFAYSSEPNVGPNAGWEPHKSIEETREIMDEIFVDKKGIYGIEERESGKLIGSIGLMEDPKRQNVKSAMLGYAMSEKYWGRGYMTEAAKTLMWHAFMAEGIELISAYCYPDNKRSRNVLEKCGMTYEGTLRLCEERFDGVILDNLCFSVTKEEFFSKVVM